MKNRIISFLLIILNLSLYGCGIRDSNSQSTLSNVQSQIITETDLNYHEETTSTIVSTKLISTTTTVVVTSTTPTTATKTEPLTTSVDIKADFSQFSLRDIPSYSGSTYVEVNNNTPFFNTYPTEVFELYSPLDSIGRCGVAYASICKELMPTEPRGEIGMIKPSGWQTVKYNELIEGNYLYNRCHLIGYQLAGENANELNLITGTRYLNTEGMEPFENKVANYVQSYDSHVLYRVTPIFEDDNLVASGVLMEAYSLEDNGAGLQFCVYCYNVQPGIEINYVNGESWQIQEKTTENSQVVPDRDLPPSDDSYTYILNTNTKKFHYPSCSSVKKMKDKNKQEYTGNRDDVISMGYDPCQNCNP